MSKTFLFLALAELANNTPQLVETLSESKDFMRLGHLYDTLDSSAMALISIDPKSNQDFQTGYLQAKLEEIFGYDGDRPLYKAVRINNYFTNEYAQAVVPNPEYPIHFRISLNGAEEGQETRDNFQHALGLAYEYARQPTTYTVDIVPVDAESGEVCGGGLLCYQKVAYRVHDGDRVNEYYYTEREAWRRYYELDKQGRAYLESQPDYGEPEFGEWDLLQTNVLEDQAHISR